MYGQQQGPFAELNRAIHSSPRNARLERSLPARPLPAMLLPAMPPLRLAVAVPGAHTRRQSPTGSSWRPPRGGCCPWRSERWAMHARKHARPCSRRAQRFERMSREEFQRGGAAGGGGGGATAPKRKAEDALGHVELPAAQRARPAAVVSPQARCGGVLPFLCVLTVRCMHVCVGSLCFVPERRCSGQCRARAVRRPRHVPCTRRRRRRP